MSNIEFIQRFRMKYITIAHRNNINKKFKIFYENKSCRSICMKVIKTKNLTIKIVRFFVSAKGFEPLTVCLEGRCSIQLSYAPLKVDSRLVNKHIKKSGRQDSNLRPPGPKPGAMTGLRYAPNI